MLIFLTADEIIGPVDRLLRLCMWVISTKILLHKSALKVEVDLLMYQCGAEYLMEVTYIEDNNMHHYRTSNETTINISPPSVSIFQPPWILFTATLLTLFVLFISSSIVHQKRFLYWRLCIDFWGHFLGLATSNVARNVVRSRDSTR